MARHPNSHPLGGLGSKRAKTCRGKVIKEMTELELDIEIVLFITEHSDYCRGACVTADGKRIDVDDMAIDHKRNTVAMIEQKRKPSLDYMRHLAKRVEAGF